jgi:hypothetical protein
MFVEHPKGKAAYFYAFEVMVCIKMGCFGLAIFFVDDK